MTSIKIKTSNNEKYYSDEEASNYIKNNIRISALWLKKEILEEERKTVWDFIFTKKELSYV